MKKQKWIAILIVSILIILGIGVKLHMDNKEVTIQENAAIEIKERYKNLKEIRIKNIFESSLGVQNVDFDVVDVNNKVIKGNTTTVGKFGSFSDNGLVEGRTIGKVKVLYLNGEVGFIK